MEEGGRLAVSCQCVRVGDWGGGGNEKYYDNIDKVNQDEVNWNVLQWHAATRNGASLTLAGYNWDAGRSAMLRWWAGWVVELSCGSCEFPLWELTDKASFGSANLRGKKRVIYLFLVKL